MIPVKNTHLLPLSVVLGISLVTTMALLGASTMLQGLAPFATAAHAMASAGTLTCAMTQGKMPLLCEHQDPSMQGCVADAQNLEIQEAVSQGRLIGEVDLRHSTRCATYWVRTIAYASMEGEIQAVHATVTFQNATSEDILFAPNFLAHRADVVAYTDMTRSLNTSPFGTGVFELLGGGQPLTIPVTLNP